MDSRSETNTNSKFSDSQASMGSQQTSASFFLQQQQTMQEIVMGKVSNQYLKAVGFYCLPYFINIICKLIVFSTVYYYFKRQITNSWILSELLAEFTFETMSQSVAQVAGQQIAKHQQLQQRGACSIIFTYGIFMQIIFTLVTSILVGIFASNFIQDFDTIYFVIRFIACGVLYTFAEGFKPYLDAEYVTNLGITYMIIFSVGKLLLMQLLLFVLKIYQIDAKLILALSTLITQLCLACISFTIMSPSKRFKVSIKFRFTHIKNFKGQILVQFLKNVFPQYFFIIQDFLIYFPACLIAYLDGNDIIKLVLFYYFSHLGSFFTDSATVHTDIYARVNLQVQRYDRMCILLQETFLYIFIISFSCSAIVLLAAEKIAILVFDNDQNVALLKLGCIRGMFSAFRIGRDIVCCEKSNLTKLKYFLVFPIVQPFIQLVVYGLRPKGTEMQYSLIYTEVFNAFYNILIYLPVLKSFKRFRKSSSEATDAPPQSEVRSTHMNNQTDSYKAPQVKFEIIDMENLDHKTFDNYVRGSSSGNTGNSGAINIGLPESSQHLSSAANQLMEIQSIRFSQDKSKDNLL